MILFKKKLSQNEKLLKNLEKYDKEKEIKQQKSKILGQKQVKDTKNQREKVN
jgi:hypothetical protein